MPRALPSELQSTCGATMIRVPAGAFLMGSPEFEEGHEVWEEQREVTFAHDFYLGRSPVTQDQYEAVIGSNPTDHTRTPDAPVDSVTWEQASEYCRKLTEVDREAGVLPELWEYRLPAEAEWEYVCRAGSLAPCYGPPSDIAWYSANAGEKPHPVGQKMPNAWGFHDLFGNVQEWCLDWYCASRKAHSTRGGSYFNSGRYCRFAYRWGWPSYPGRYFGFRLLAAQAGSIELTPPIDGFPPQEQPPSIYDALEASDFELAGRILTADPAAIESVDEIPPPLHAFVYAGRPKIVEWLLDHGADIERREQDYGATPLTSAVVMRKKQVIPLLIARGANTEGQLARARNGLAGAYEQADEALDREGYREIVELLQRLGVGE